MGLKRKHLEDIKRTSSPIPAKEKVQQKVERGKGVKKEDTERPHRFEHHDVHLSDFDKVIDED